jgi:putative phosphoribosyl transferase
VLSEYEVEIPVGSKKLYGRLDIPENPLGLVIFVHGSGSSRFSPRNQAVSNVLNNEGIATLLVDLLTSEEELIDERNAKYRFNISLLAHRLVTITRWLSRNSLTSQIKIGYFGASTGAAAAILAAIEMPESVAAVVCRGGRTDLAVGANLRELRVPILMIVGSEDKEIIKVNLRSSKEFQSLNDIRVIQGATHLFQEEGALDQVAREATSWFLEAFKLAKRVSTVAI